jgi:hypothetical protein
MLLTPLTGDRRGELLAAYPAAVEKDVVKVLGTGKIELDAYFRSNPTPMKSPLEHRRSPGSTPKRIGIGLGQESQ